MLCPHNFHVYSVFVIHLYTLNADSVHLEDFIVISDHIMLYSWAMQYIIHT